MDSPFFDTILTLAIMLRLIMGGTGLEIFIFILPWQYALSGTLIRARENDGFGPEQSEF